MIVPLDGSDDGRPLLAHPKHSEANAEISPDGRWIAYDSNESGGSEVYVRPFPNVDRARWQISAGGGRHPLWARTGRELLFRSSATPVRLMSVSFGDGAAFTYGRSQAVPDLTPYVMTGTGRQFDMSPDGTRFLMVKPPSSDASAIVVVSHWFDEVRAKVDAAR